MNNKIQTIYEILETNDKILVNKVISQLTDEDKELFCKRFGNDLEKPFLSSDWNYNDSIQFYTRLIPNMKKILSEITKVDSLNNNMDESKRLTICELLKTDRKDLVQQVINELSEKESLLFKRAKGYDLDNPILASDFSINENIAFYSHLIPKMKQMLQEKISSQEAISDDKISNEETSDYELLNEENLNKTPIEEENKIINKQRKGKKLLTIYQILKTDDKDLVKELINSLTIEEQNLFKRRNGADLNNPVLSSDWTSDDTTKFCCYLIPKLRRILKNKYNIENPKKTKNIFNILGIDDEKVLNELVNSLTIEEQNLFKRRNGDNLTKPKQSDDWTHDDTIKYNVIIKKMKRRLLRMKTNKPSRILTMYKLLNTNDKNLILEIVNELSDKERQLFWSRNGADLDHPVPSDDWNYKYQRRFHANLLPKMRKMICDRKNNNKIEDKLLTNETLESETFDKNKSIEILEIPDVQLEKATIEKNGKNTEIDTIVDNTLLPHFDEVLKELSIKDAIIVLLKLGFSSKYTTDDISNFLKIDKEEIINITKNSLNIYKKYFTNYIDSMIDDKPMEVETKQKDYTIMLQNLTFGSLLNEIPIMDAIIMCLFLGLVNDKKFTLNEISVFFKIEKEEIIRINKKSLPLYKKIINDNINKVIEEVTEQKTK